MSVPEAGSSRRWMDMPRFRDRDPGQWDRPILPGRLRLRLATPFVVFVALVLIVLYLVLGAKARDFYEDRYTSDLAEEAYLVTLQISSLPNQPPSDAEVQAIVDRGRAGIDARITVIGPDGTVIADSDSDPATMDNHNNRPEVIDARQSALGTSQRKSVTFQEQYIYVAVPASSPPGYVVRMSVPAKDISEVVARLQRYILIAGVSAIALTLAAAWFIAGRITRPLDDLRRHAHEVAGGNLASRVGPSDVQELAEVAYAFNTMTEEVQVSHEELDQIRVRLEAVLGGLADGVVLTDAEGLVLRLNQAAERILATDEQSAIGKPFMQVARDHEIYHLLNKALKDETHATGTIEHGINQRTLLTSASVIEDAQERLGLVVLRDITDLRRLELVRREFVANVSHELRTPLTSIRAMVETLESGIVEDQATTNDFLGRIVGEVDRLTALVEDLLDLARLEAGRTRMTFAMENPVEVVEGGAERLRAQVERAQLSMEVTHGEGILQIPLDKVRIEQVLVNLIHNAVKFTPPGGSITLDVQQTSDKTQIVVADTGIGIAREDQARLFERFYKSDRARSSQGTGLGLAIVKHIVQTHDGDISVQSEPGEGAVFTVTLPNARPRLQRRGFLSS